jgi:two-component system sensor histidine kinase PilS (NtrC family)
VLNAPKREGSGLDEQTELRLVWLMGGRLFLALSSLVIAAGLDGIGRDLTDEARNGIYWTVTFAFFAAVISGTSFGRIRNPLRFATTQIAMDVAIVTSLVHFSGGRQSVFTFLYVLVILYGALLFKSRIAIGAAGLSVVAYGLALVTGNEGFGLGLVAANARIELPRLFAVWVVQGAGLFAVGALASLLSRELQRTGAALDRSTIDLRLLKDLHRSTVDSIMSGLLTTDSDGRISSFNPEAERITGIGRDLALGKKLDTIIPGATQILTSFGGQAPEGAGRTRLAYENPNRGKLYLGLADSILRGEDGTPQGHVVIFQDVTDVVAMEASLTRSERLAAVGELSAKIAHEIRNPLASISGSIQILASEAKVDGESARLMGIAIRETDRLNVLITDFLRYARPAPTVTKSVRVDALFEDLLEMIQQILPENITLAVDINKGHRLESDSDQLSQMLWNLCLNSIQAMSEGGVLRISVRPVTPQGGPATFRQETTQETAPDTQTCVVDTQRVDDAPQWLEIEITDTGSGISEDVMVDIFEPFFTTKRDGTGLGLPTVHRIVENHGGALELTSEPGVGTKFCIRLPGSEVPR